MKKMLATILALGMVSSMTACNYQIVDLTYNYKTDAVLMTKEPDNG